MLSQKGGLKLRKTGLHVILGLLLLLGSFMVVYISFGGLYPYIGDSKSHEKSEYVPVHLEFREVFAQCGHEEVIMEESLQLLEVESSLDMAQRYPGWTMTEYSPDKVVFTRTQEGLCREDREYRHLKIKDGHVAVFYGKPRPDAILMKTTKIEAQYLPEEETRSLEEGLVVKDESELLYLLEGLASLQPF